MIKKILVLILFIGLGVALDRYVFMPQLIDMRAHELGFMEYDGTTGEHQAKDSVVFTRSDFYYIKHGTMKGY